MHKDFSQLFIKNTWVAAAKTAQVVSPYDSKKVGTVGVADTAAMNQAIKAADQAFAEMKKLPAYAIADGLTKMKAYFEEHLEEVAADLSVEAGKPITIARLEVNRALHTLEDGIEESKRQYGEVLPLDRRPWGEGRRAIIERFPIGAIAAIAPFNFPLNLVMHKVVPALASKNTVIVRPATQTPFSALHIAKAYQASGLPAGGLNVLPSDYAAVDTLITDPRVKMVSFTGSGKVGWELKKKAFDKKVVLELGGNAAAVIHQDCLDLEKAASVIVTGGFANAGQSCISVQRVFVHSSLHTQLVKLLKKKVSQLIVGDPSDEETQVASLINTQEADRIMRWIAKAQTAGAQLVTGGTRQNNVIQPTVLTNTTPTMKVNCKEIFGPVISVEKYDDFDQVIKEINDSEYGLQVGIFTNSLDLVNRAYRELEVGGVLINESPTYRIDHMPYGGIKQSGMGREGVRFAMEEMTEPKLLIITEQ